MIDASSSMTDALPFVQAAASRLIRSLRPTDQARLVAFDARATVLVDFTADWEALLDAIERIRTGQHTALHSALYAELRALSRVPPRRLWRQAIVLLSDGEDTGSLVSEDRVLDLARRTDAVIYAIGPRPKHVPREARLSLGRAGYLLAALARETGGEAYFPRSASELEPIYRRIANGLAAQYTLGYVSSNRAADGSWRRLSVRTPAREGLALRHRTGYYAIAPGGRSSP
jgi:Ca-activated chloride channel family protein